MSWAPLLVASAACYAIKLAGLSLPQRFLRDPRIQRTVPLLPVALLAALIATQTFAHLLEARIRANPHLWYQFYRYWDASDNG